MTVTAAALSASAVSSLPDARRDAPHPTATTHCTNYAGSLVHPAPGVACVLWILGGKTRIEVGAYYFPARPELPNS